MKKLSKFEDGFFPGAVDGYAVSKQRFTKQEAIEKAKCEFGLPLDTPCTLAITTAWVVHRAGVDEDNEPCVGWWLEYSERKKSCPVWAFHLCHNRDIRYEKNYEHIEIEPEPGGEVEG